MMDIDFFKSFNDEYGHLAGDRILAQIGKIVSRNKRMEDVFCRYGGEEFALLMPELDLKGATEYAERLRKIIADTKFIFDESALKVTLSFGVADALTSMSAHTQLIEIADDNLYKAKGGGRNRVYPKPDSVI